MTWDDILEDNYDWCDIKSGSPEQEQYLNDVWNYRNQVKNFLLELLDSKYEEFQELKRNCDSHNPILTWHDSIFWIFMMGIEHTKIHVETSSCIIAQLNLDEINLPEKDSYKNWQFQLHDSHKKKLGFRDRVQNKLVKVKAETNLTLGKNFIDSNFYGWDNEFGTENEYLENFSVSQFLVSNLEFKEFVSDSGYQNPSFWCEEGWRYVTDMKVTQPRFWLKIDNETYLRTIYEVIKMPWNWPVCCNNLEAAAFCRWKGRKLGKSLRLISHEEETFLRQNAENETANLNLRENYCSPTPVNQNYGLVSGQKIYDISGNVWRHSCSLLTIMDGFKPHKVYDDFTLPTIDGFHNFILGGSFISMGNCANIGGRYGFRRHFYQWAGIRYVESNNSYHDSVPIIFPGKVGNFCTENFYNFTHLLELKNPEILKFFQPDEQHDKSNPFNKLKICDNFYENFGDICAEEISKSEIEQPNVLVVNGSTGRLTLEILRKVKNRSLKIHQTDPTANNLNVLENLLKHGKINWYQKLEGNIFDILEYKLGDTEHREICHAGHDISYLQLDYRKFL